jgi:hypothetical protein
MGARGVPSPSGPGGGGLVGRRERHTPVRGGSWGALRTARPVKGCEAEEITPFRCDSNHALYQINVSRLDSTKLVILMCFFDSGKQEL